MDGKFSVGYRDAVVRTVVNLDRETTAAYTLILEAIGSWRPIPPTTQTVPMCAPPTTLLLNQPSRPRLQVPYSILKVTPIHSHSCPPMPTHSTLILVEGKEQAAHQHLGETELCACPPAPMSGALVTVGVAVVPVLALSGLLRLGTPTCMQSCLQ